MPKTYLKNSIVMSLLLCSIMAFVLVTPGLRRGLFFREDYLPFLSTAAILFALVSFVAVLRGDSLWHGDVDLLLALIVGLYCLSNLWAQSKMNAMDGALKYAGYLMIFVAARYASSWELGNRILRNLLILSGVVVASAGYLTAAGLAQFPSSVVNGALLGSFQYPNALAAFAMFLLFLLYYAWYEGFRNPALDLPSSILYSVSAFLLVGSVFLTDSRATLLMFTAFMVVYAVLLPSVVRLKIISRACVSVLSFAAVASKLDTALRNKDTASMKQGLIFGLALAAVLEVVRWVGARRFCPCKKVCTETAGTVFRPEKQGASPRSLLLRLGITVVIVAVLAMGLVAGVRNPTTGPVLARVLPARLVGQLKSLSLTDVSMLIRFMATKDAFSIALGYPFGTGAGGWEALYHQYHRTPYWFTETHNHFAQMLVEVGFPGLILYAMFWGLLAYAAVKAYSSILKSNDGSASLGALAKVTSSAMAVFAMGIHSALDFDLSLPAISVALFASIGVLLSDLGDSLPRCPRPKALFKSKGGTAGPSKKVSRNTAARVAFPWAMVVTILAAVALTTPVAAISNRLYKGMAYASRGAQVMASSGDLQLARRYLGEAMDLDKWNPSYPLELAEWAVDDFVKTGNPASRGMVPLYLKAARMADPTDLDRQLIEYQSYRDIGMTDEALRAAYELVFMMPTNRSFYETLADLGRASISDHIRAILNSGATEPERENHLSLLARSCELMSSGFDILDAKRERVTGIYTRVFNPSGLNFTPKIALAAGEVAFLEGDIQTSGALLATAAKDKALAQEANTWLSYLIEAAGYNATLPAGFQANVEETRLMDSLFGVLRASK